MAVEEEAFPAPAALSNIDEEDKAGRIAPFTRNITREFVPVEALGLLNAFGCRRE